MQPRGSGGAGLFLAPFVYRRNKLMMPAAGIFAVAMILNGLGHIASSIYYIKIMAGMVTSPFLIFFSAWFIFQNCKKILPDQSQLSE
jgi:hypothetical protein